jgi:L-lactate dehydrogenase complex protein LldG
MVEGTGKMNEREHLFTRIREALTVKAPAHHGDSLPTSAEHRCVLPTVGTTMDEQLALFAQNAADLKATFILVNHEDDLARALQVLADKEQWQRVATHQGGLANKLAGLLGLPLLMVDGGYDKSALALCDAGISECDALVAQTGSVVVTSMTAGGRALSCLPPHHVVITRRSQLVPDLTSAFSLIREKHAAHYPSMISFITGPSRTGDIERILVLGAHGPKQLTIFCIQD